MNCSSSWRHAAKRICDYLHSILAEMAHFTIAIDPGLLQSMASLFPDSMFDGLRELSLEHIGTGYMNSVPTLNRRNSAAEGLPNPDPDAMKMVLNAAGSRTAERSDRVAANLLLTAPFRREAVRVASNMHRDISVRQI